MKYTVSMAVHNCLSATVQCINSLLKTIPAQTSWELIVTNNASDSPTREYLETLYENKALPIQVINNDKNVGFGEAHNNALYYAQGDYFVVINNDLVFKSFDWLGALENALQKSLVELVGVSGMCGVLDAKGYGKELSKISFPEYVEGSCLMIRTNFAKRITLFDTDMFPFAYCEDSDLSLRVRKLGYKIDTIPLNITHHRYVTGKVVEKSLDLVGINKMNHLRFFNRWESYLATRSFKEEIILKRGGGNGDVLLLTPIIEALKTKNPHCVIKVDSNCEHVLINNPHITDLEEEVFMPQYSRKYEVDLNDAYEELPTIHIVDAYAKKVEKVIGESFEVRDTIPRVYHCLNKDEAIKKSVDLLLQDVSQPICCTHFEVHPDWVGRTFSPTKIHEVHLLIESLGFTVYNISSRDSLTTSELYEIMSRASLFVGIDSFPFHIAQAFHIPAAVLFGIINPAYRISEPCLVEPIQNKWLKCLGCHHFLPSPRTVTRQCSRDFSMGTNSLCVADISNDQIINSIKEVLKRAMYLSETHKIRDRVTELLSLYFNDISSLPSLHGLDIGCGHDKLFPNCIGLDRRPLPGVDVLTNAVELPFEDNQFDYVYSSHCLEDIANTEKTLVEWKRVVKPNGYLFLYLPHREHYKGFNADHVHGQGFINQEITELLTKIGFTIVADELDVGEDRYSLLVVGRKDG